MKYYTLTALFCVTNRVEDCVFRSNQPHLLQVL